MVENRKGYDIIIHTILVLVCICCIAPFLLLISSSFTAENSLIKDGYFFFPREFSLEAYQFLLSDNSIFRAYGVTILLTLVGTALNLMITTLIAYPLSIRDMPGRNLVNFYVFFTMLFAGGLVPTYMMWTQIFHIKNTFAALLFPSLLTNGFTIMMMRSYFQQNIPAEVLESARIDGANEFYILFKIVIPMSLPIMATIGLMAGLAYWNDWSNNLYYITDSNLNSIQGLLNRMLTNAQYINQTATMGNVGTASVPTTAVRMGVAVLGAVPILCIYPFFQKYFVKGMTMGAVKG
ncbi:MAG: carbohydrate ABC transporter permease [Eubacteriales bacterium]|nr:carbohydrate ABC transporter permease [Eubacteriales bacterium]